jgi:hypothetical protein
MPQLPASPASAVTTGQQLAPQAWNPALHTKLHCPAVHVACPLAGALQGVHDVPQEATDESSAHAEPQT